MRSKIQKFRFWAPCPVFFLQLWSYEKWKCFLTNFEKLVFSTRNQTFLIFQSCNFIFLNWPLIFPNNISKETKIFELCKISMFFRRNFSGSRNGIRIIGWNRIKSFSTNSSKMVHFHKIVSNVFAEKLNIKNMSLEISKFDFKMQIKL